MSTCTRKPSTVAMVSGQKITERSLDSGLSIPLQKCSPDDRRLVDMGEVELDEFFDGLIVLVEHDGTVQ